MSKQEEKTTLELYKSFKNKRFACLIGKWLSIISPFVVIGIVNFNDYFTEYNGVKMSIGCTLAMAVAGFAIYDNVKGENKKVSTVIKWGIAFGLAIFFNNILEDLVFILGCGFAGQLVGAGFDLGITNYQNKMDILYKANVQAQANNQAANNE